VKILYRISDGSYNKQKIVNKEKCLTNFISCFPTREIILLVDKINQDTKIWLEELIIDTGIKTEYITGGSSAQSFRIALEYAINNFDDNEIVYFVEDDYLHLQNSRKILLEGMSYSNGIYLSLYDCPDKYRSEHCPYVNPKIDNSGGEVTRVIITKSHHFKASNSTTLTFATRINTLKEDWEVWKKWCFVDNSQIHPHDYEAFLELGERGRSLLTPIPSLSTHTEPLWLAPLIDWRKI